MPAKTIHQEDLQVGDLIDTSLTRDGSAVRRVESIEDYPGTLPMDYIIRFTDGWSISSSSTSTFRRV